MNRGLARRTVFEGRKDMRMFLAELARAVRSKRIEVHAYALLSTHFHLLVRSPGGELGEAMRRVQNAYVRWFNRSRKRDGPLFRGRYCSRRITNNEYRLAVVRYIDRNPMDARLALRPELYEFCSARAYHRQDGPAWLERTWIEAEVLRICGRSNFRSEDYTNVFHDDEVAAMPTWVGTRVLTSGEPDDELDSLSSATPTRVFQWMLRKAAIGDGTRAGISLCDPKDARLLVLDARNREGAWSLAGHGPSADAWTTAHVVLLRLLCGASLRAIAPRCGLSKSAVKSTLDRHRERMAKDRAYGLRMAELAQRLIARGSARASIATVAATESCATVDEVT